MTLHTTSDVAHLARCLPALGPGDSLLLLGSAIGWHADQPPPAQVGAEVYALKDDLELLGFDPAAGIQVIDYAGWLQLTETHAQHVHWR